MYRPAPVRRRLLVKSVLVASSVAAVLVAASAAQPAYASSSTPVERACSSASKSADRTDGRNVQNLDGPATAGSGATVNGPLSLAG